jgi:hypothetical protein
MVTYCYVSQVFFWTQLLVTRCLPGALALAWGTSPFYPSSSSSRTAHRRSPATVILYHKHHVVMLLIPSTSTPTLASLWWRTHHCATCVQLSEALFVVALDRDQIARKELYYYIIHILLNV